MLYDSVLAFAATPFVIRALRLVVACNKDLRAKYARFVKVKAVTVAWAVVVIVVATRALLFFGSKSEHYSR